MPRQYLAPTDFAAHPLGIALGAGGLQAGVLDRALFRASQRVDKFCRRKLGYPSPTTLSTGVAAGASQLQLVSSLGFDGTPDTVVQIGTGATQETLRVAGLTNVLATPAPYAGTLTLYPGVVTQYAHNQNEPVQQLYYEQQNPQTSATSKQDQYFDFTQAGQIAEAHAPKLGLGENVRVVFVRNYPILQVVAFSVAYPWANVLDPGTPSDLFIENMEGWVRFPIGYFIPPDSVVHLTYTAGYMTLPDDVQQAVLLETAAELAWSANPYNASSMRIGSESMTFARLGTAKGEALTLMTAEAAQLLAPYVNGALT